MQDEKDETPLDGPRQDYWDAYYRSQTTSNRPLPSQFAVFVAGEVQSKCQVLDFGCGNGRDSLFFSSRGHDVFGIDGSLSAVQRGRELASQLGESVEFIASAIDDPTLKGKIPAPDGLRLIYARFFLHAITAEEQQTFLDCAESITAPGDVLAVEYRTVRDAALEKVTRSHYRRFIEPPSFQAQAIDSGFAVTYAVEGFGLAKYLDDDAYVARCMLARR